MREDLRVPLPTIDVLLNEIDHPVVRKANEQFAQPTGPRERIRGLDDIVAFKVKIQRWRGAVLDDGEPSWLLAAGIREDGSRDDFYEALTSSAKSARARLNADGVPSGGKETYSGPWLPTADDRDRYAAEGARRLLAELESIIRDLVCKSLLDGQEHEGQIVGA